MWNAASYIGIKSANMDETKQRFLSAIVSRDIHQKERKRERKRNVCRLMHPIAIYHEYTGLYMRYNWGYICGIFEDIWRIFEIASLWIFHGTLGLNLGPRCIIQIAPNEVVRKNSYKLCKGNCMNCIKNYEFVQIVCNDWETFSRLHVSNDANQTCKKACRTHCLRKHSKQKNSISYPITLFVLFCCVKQKNLATVLSYFAKQFYQNYRNTLFTIKNQNWNYRTTLSR